MMFINVPFPECLAFGAISAPMWKTVLAENQGGWTQANQIWVYNKHSYDVSTAVRTNSDYALVIDHFNEVRGRANTFPFKDPLDYEVSADRGAVIYVSPGVYQLAKQYGTVNPYYRKITRPVLLGITNNGNPMTAGGGPGQYALNTATGALTVIATQNRTVNSHTVGATHQFTLASALSPNVSIGQEVYVAGVTGSAAALLNGQRLTVSNVSGADVSVSVNTTGLVASGGILSLFPADSALSWSGEFWVPARYGNDSLPAQALSGNGEELFVQASSISIIEDRE